MWVFILKMRILEEGDDGCGAEWHPPKSNLVGLA